MDAFSRLNQLASQRKARTATLHAAIQTFLIGLPQDRPLTANGRRLRRIEYRSRNDWYGYGWEYTCDGESCDLRRPVGSEGYLGGQFDMPYTGPTRELLLDFAAHAAALVEAGIAAEAASCDQLEAAASSLER